MASEIIEMEARLKDMISGQTEAIRKSLEQMGISGQEAFGKTDKGAKTTLATMKGFIGAQVVINAARKAWQKLADVTKNTIETNITYEKTMSRIDAILIPTTKDMAKMAAQARELGKDTVYTASQAGDAFVEMGKRGMEANQIIAASAGVLDLAAAAQIEMALAAGVTVATLNQFNLEAEESTRVVDVMTASFNDSALDINSFSEAMKMSGAVAANTNVTLEQTTGVLAVLADREIKGSLAGTALRRIFLELADESSKASRAIAATGLEAGTVTEKFQALKKANLSVTEVTDMFSLRATTAAQILIKNADSIDTMTEAYENANGTAKDMANTMIDNVAGAAVRLTSAQEELALSLGDALVPALREWNEMLIEITKGLTAIINSMNHFSEAQENINSANDKAIVIGIEMKNNETEMAALRKSTAVEIVANSEANAKLALRRINDLKRLEKLEERQLDLQQQQGDLITKTETAKDPRSKMDGFGEDVVLTDKTEKKLSEEEQNAANKRIKEAAKTRYILQEIKIKAFEKELKEIEKRAAEKIRIDKETAKQLADAEQTLRDTKISLEQDETTRELQALEAKWKDRIAVVTAGSEAEAALIEARGLEVAALKEQHRVEDIEKSKIQVEESKQIALDEKENKIQNFKMITGAAQELGTSLINLSRQSRLNRLADEKAKIANMDVSEEKKKQLLKKAEAANRQAAKKEKAIALAQAGINTALAITNAFTVKPLVPLGITMAALAATSGAVQMATIAKARFAQGGVVPGNSFSGDRVPILANSGELVLNNSQQAQLLGMANGATTNNNNNQRNMTFNLYGGATQSDATMLIDTLMEADREGNLEDFKIQIREDI